MFRSTLGRLIAFQDAVEESMKNNYFGHSTVQRGSQPAINIFKKEDQIIITAELAGVKKEDIQLEIKKDQLRISGKREIKYEDNISVHRLERRNYNFDRTINLPFETEPELVKASFENGILSLSLSETEQSKPKKITII